MTEICLVRHGQTDWNFQELIQGREDIPLNTIGRMQAVQSAQLLSKEKWDVVVSSPLVRAYETATVIADAIGIDNIHLDERFIERDFGAASGKPVAEVRQMIADGNVEGMETDEAIIQRCFLALQDVGARFEGKRIIVVAHAHAIKAILHAIHPEEITFQTFLKNACISHVYLKDNTWRVLRYNIAEHISV